jgi:DNA-directed RNA polymerase subunit beta'
MAYKLSYFNKSSSRFLYIGKNILRLNKKPLNLIGTFSLPLKKEEKDKGRSKDLTNFFWNQTFDKGRLKTFVLWFLEKNGEHKTIRLVEELKNVGFEYATKAGISLGVEDLKIPKKKYSMMMDAEELADLTIKQYKRNEITAVEKYQRLIETWHRVSETLKQEVIANFEATDILNPVYMMAFSGARGNISQVRQLVGMRGLMSNPNGQIIDFPIRSNFREGLTLTEYIISSYGARKGIVDTALRTANAGYLTRRLVDVAQHVIISNFDCHTRRGIFLTDMKEGNKIIYSLQARLVGRFLARDIINKQNKKIANRNTEISLELSNIIAQNVTKVFVRSSLTCETKKLVCQLCYGWSLAQGNLVSIGEAIGVIAAQSIGEPGTQLTMRTFHTGGVFSGDMTDQIKANFTGIVSYPEPIAGTLIRTPE